MECRGSQNDGRRGQGLVEYALVLILITIVCITALSLLGKETTNLIPTPNDFEVSEE